VPQVDRPSGTALNRRVRCEREKGENMKLEWPNGHSFAFTICDDTDNGTLENLRPIYGALFEAGLRTTKTVWCLPCLPSDPFRGETLTDSAYLTWVKDLSNRGFEIAWHGTRSGGATRAEIEQSLHIFRDSLGSWPSTYANHASNIENIYWGAERFDNPLLRLMYRWTRQDRPAFLGSSPHGNHFWGDLCVKYVKYVRDFTFNEIVTTKADPFMPYYDPKRPLVRSWFSSSDGANVNKFADLLQPANLNRLERVGGACIVYTHFASGFVTDGRIDSRFQSILDNLQERDGWYVPVNELLGFLEKNRGVRTILKHQRLQLESRWALEHFGAAASRIQKRLTRNHSATYSEINSIARNP
jgi:hypothetical protein